MFAYSKRGRTVSTQPAETKNQLHPTAGLFTAPHTSPYNLLQLQRALGNRVATALVQSPARSDLLHRESTIQRNPIGSVGRAAANRALRWMASRYGRTVTTHIARHAVMLAGRVGHTVFRSPNRIRVLIERTLSNPHNVLLQQGRRILGGGERILSQEPLTYAIEREFPQAIGTQGERILRVIIRRSGEIVTAYPVRSFTRATAGAGAALLVLDSATANAQERFAEIQAEAQRRIQAAEPSFFEELMDDMMTFGLFGGRLNEGEDTMLWQQREVSQVEGQVYEQVLAAAENEARRSFSTVEREQIRQLVITALTTPTIIEQQLTSIETESGE